MPKPKVVLFIIHSLQGGGAERVMSNLMHQASLDPTLDVHLALIHDTREYPVPANVTVHTLDKPRTGLGPKLLGQLYAATALVRVVKDVKPVSMLAFMPRANSIALAGKLLCKTWPSVTISERTSPLQQYTGATARLVRFAIKHLYRFADHIVAVSSEVKSELELIGAPSFKITHIPNPLNLAHIQMQGENIAEAHNWATHKDGHVLIVAAGRLDPEKGFDVLIRALALLKDTLKFRVLIFGKGREAKSLKLLGNELLGDLIEFPGFWSNTFATIKLADVFILSSRVEGTPNVLLEAQSLGVPCIATKCGGVADVMTDASGMLVDIGNTAQMAEAIYTMLTDSSRFNIYGAIGQEIMQAHSADIIWARYRELLVP